MSDTLRQLMADKQAAFKAAPAKALATFESRSGLIDGFQTPAALREAVNAHGPVLDIVANPVPVELGFEVVRPITRAAAE